MGFIGRRVSQELLGCGHEVLIYDSDAGTAADALPGATLVHADVRDRRRLASVVADADWVFHLSGVLGTSELFDDPETAIDVNIKGALNVLLACRGTKVKRVFLANKPNEWNNIYSVTSQAVEKLGHSFREHMNVDARVLRIWNVYGPRQKLFPIRKVVPHMVMQALRGAPLELFGDGTQMVELLYVDDVARAIVDFLFHAGNVESTYELKAVRPMSALDLAHTIIRLTNSNSTVRLLPMRTGESVSTRFAAASSLAQLLPGLSQTPLNEGLLETIEWFRSMPAVEMAAAWRFYAQTP
jgi:nucleoside-diphosphate-sugar epimerase